MTGWWEKGVVVLLIVAGYGLLGVGVVSGMLFVGQPLLGYSALLVLLIVVGLMITLILTAKGE